MVPVVGDPGKKACVPLTKEEMVEGLLRRFEGHTLIDIEYICKKLLEKTTRMRSSSSGSPFVLITTNRVNQAQSADVIVFSSSHQGGKRTAVLNIDIHLYQATNYKNFSGGEIKSEEKSKWVHSLGVCTRKEDPHCINSAYYSQVGMDALIESLKI